MSYTVLYDYIIFFGGEKGRDFTDDLYTFNLRTFEWTKHDPRGRSPEARAMHTACLIDDNEILFYGGMNHRDGVLDDIRSLKVSIPKKTRFDSATLEMNWETPRKLRATRFSTCRYGHTSHVVQHERMYVFGGLDESHEPTNTLLYLDLCKL